jgi:hypothetical protein
MKKDLKTVFSLINNIEETFDGCHCGFHGYTVLPDCDEDDHSPDRCARCLVRELKCGQIKEVNKNQECLRCWGDGLIL